MVKKTLPRQENIISAKNKKSSIDKLPYGLKIFAAHRFPLEKILIPYNPYELLKYKLLL
jgi:hypothetical protein